MPVDDVLPGFDPPSAAGVEPVGPQPVRIQQRLIDAARIDSGIHPATKLPLANNGKTCGDRLVAERAWDEGYNAGHYVETEKHECDCPRANPYRKEQENNNA